MCLYTAAASHATTATKWHMLHLNVAGVGVIGECWMGRSAPNIANGNGGRGNEK